MTSGSRIPDDVRRSEPALAEPQVRVKAPYLATMALTNFAVMLAFLTFIQNLLPRMAAEVAGDGGKVVALGVILGVGVVGSVFGNPLAGALSDRTTSRWGRRRPWILGGAIIGAIALVVLPSMNSVIGLTLVWFVVQIAINGTYAGLTATIPDQVPVDQRGVASGWVGLSQTLGTVIGVVLVSYVITGLAAGSYLIAGLFLVLCLPFLFVLKDHPLKPQFQEPFRLGAFVKRFWISPRDHPDFAWAWAARFLVSLGISMATLSLLCFLQDQLGFSEEEAAQKQALLIGLYAFGTMLTAVIGGSISDRSGKRRIFVVMATVIIAIAALLLAFAQGFTIVIVAALLLGLGYGWYLAVDQALITQVLPYAEDRARDLGVINIAIAGPQALAPVLAAPLVTSLGGYPALYVVTCVVTLLGAVAVWPIKSVP